LLSRSWWCFRRLGGGLVLCVRLKDGQQNGEEN
jgi:hypothetical protein